LQFKKANKFSFCQNIGYFQGKDNQMASKAWIISKSSQKLQISFHFIWRIIAQFGKHSEFVRLDN